MTVEIRECRTEDFDAVAKLLHQLWPDKIFDRRALKHVYEHALGSAQQKLIVGLVDGKLVGFCSLTIKNNLWVCGNLGTVDELIVDANYRRTGIGKQLINKIFQIAIENNCKRIELDSSFHRKEAHRFYESIGFKSRALWFTKILEK